MPKKFWNNYYKHTPLDKIPWQNTQASWFTQLLAAKRISGNSALDLGCGTGKKSLQLARHKFNRVVGVDISPAAIKYANQSLATSKIKSQVKFFTHDATDLSFLGEQTFDLVLDWANLHGIPVSKQDTYINQILQHTHSGSLLLLRCFSKRGHPKRLFFFAQSHGIRNRINLFSRSDIGKLYKKYFTILKTNQSNPKTNIGFEFDEYLMKRKIR